MVEQAARSTIERRLGDDGVGYAWTEFVDYYDDVDVAAAIWDTAQIVVAPETPRFEPGSIVRVHPDTTPGVHPMHAEGILVAKVLEFANEGHYYVTPLGSKRRRRVSGKLLTYTRCKKKTPRMNNPSTELTFIPPLCLVS